MTPLGRRDLGRLFPFQAKTPLRPPIRKKLFGRGNVHVPARDSFGQSQNAWYPYFPLIPRLVVSRVLMNPYCAIEQVECGERLENSQAFVYSVVGSRLLKQKELLGALGSNPSLSASSLPAPVRSPCEVNAVAHLDCNILGKPGTQNSLAKRT